MYEVIFYSIDNQFVWSEAERLTKKKANNLADELNEDHRDMPGYFKVTPMIGVHA